MIAGYSIIPTQNRFVQSFCSIHEGDDPDRSLSLAFKPSSNPAELWSWRGILDMSGDAEWQGNSPLADIMYNFMCDDIFLPKENYTDILLRSLHCFASQGSSLTLPLWTFNGGFIFSTIHTCMDIRWEFKGELLGGLLWQTVKGYHLMPLCLQWLYARGDLLTNDPSKSLYINEFSCGNICPLQIIALESQTI